MAKIDLIDNGWVDLVFEGKNKEYGAYVLRRDTGKRNVKALIWVLIGIAAIFGIAYANLAIQNAMKQNTTIDTDVELSKLAQKKEAKVERKEPVKVEMEKVVEKVKSSVKFTAPEETTDYSSIIREKTSQFSNRALNNGVYNALRNNAKIYLKTRFWKTNWQLIRFR